MSDMTLEPVTPEMIERWVQRVSDMADDPEAAHAEEDAIFHLVLQAIAEGVADPAGCARAALKSCDLNFPRWCA